MSIWRNYSKIIAASFLSGHGVYLMSNNVKLVQWPLIDTLSVALEGQNMGSDNPSISSLVLDEDRTRPDTLAWPHYFVFSFSAVTVLFE